MHTRSVSLTKVSLPLVAVALLALPSLVWSQQSLRAGAKGATAEAPVTSSPIDTDHQALDVYVRGGAGGGVSVSEDAAHVPSEAIVPLGCRRKDVAASSAGADGDWATVDCDATGALRITGGGGSGGGASMVDDAAFTPAVTSFTPIGALFNDVTPDSVNEGDGGVLRMSANRDLYTTIRDAAGSERGVNVNASNELLTSANTELPAAVTLGDNTTNPAVPGVAAFLMCFDGTTWDRCQGGLTDTDDGTIAAAQDPSLLMALPYAFNGTDWKRPVADPCGTLAKTYLPINISTATTTEVTPALAGASTHYYVCSINIGPVAGAQNVALVDDDSDGCGSVTSGLAGGTTAGSGWNIAANGGLVLGNGASSVARTGGTNRVLCLVTSAAVQTSGVMTVVAAP